VLIPGRGAKFFVAVLRPAVEPNQPTIELNIGALSTGVKWPGRDANHSPVFSLAPSEGQDSWCAVMSVLHLLLRPSHRLGMEMAEVNRVHLAGSKRLKGLQLFVVQVHPQLLLQSKCASVSICVCPVIRFVLSRWYSF
jgi:hypothetical protein